MPFAELRAVQSEDSKTVCCPKSRFHWTTLRVVNRQDAIKQKGPVVRLGPLALLGAWRCTTLAWHLPHYHRRSCVSLLSSEWIQVVPQRYCHQAKTCPE